MSGLDDLTKLATVLYEVVGEIGSRNLLPMDFTVEWLGKLHPMCANYTCKGCGEPIRFNEEMVGSDVFSIYAHARCEEKAQQNWKAEHITPPTPKLEPANPGDSDG